MRKRNVYLAITIVAILLVSIVAYIGLSGLLNQTPTQYQVSFVANPSGGGTTSPSGTNVTMSAGLVSISATPNSGYIFLSWSTTGSITVTNSTSASTTASIGSSGTITANFASTIAGGITVNSGPAGSGYVRVDGEAVATPATFAWTIGSTHTLQAVSPVVGPTGTQYVWTGWSDGGSQNHTYTVSGPNVVVTANYKTQNQVTFGWSGLDDLANGTVVTVTIGSESPTKLGYESLPFTYWVDSLTVVTSSYQSSVSGKFSGLQYDLVDVTGPSSATVSSPLTITGNYHARAQTLTVSSTTSLYETGLLDAVSQSLQAKYPWITVKFLSQGTGAAIQTAIRGDADMIMVHDPTQETTFLTGKYGVNRKIIGYNFFEIVGPPSDPANVTGLAPLDAMKKIKTLGEQGKAIWVSRGDGSGTNSKEKNLWKAAGIDWAQISKESWYKSTGQGMTATLQVSDQLGGYTLTDEASYLNNYQSGNIKLKVVVNAQKDLLNVYSVIMDNPLNANLTRTNFGASMVLVQYLVSGEGQQLLANFGVSKFGKALFSPFVPLVSSGSNATLLGWIKNFSYLNGTECPAAYRYKAGDLYSNPWDTIIATNFQASVPPTQYLSSSPFEIQHILTNCSTTVSEQPPLGTYIQAVADESKAGSQSTL